MRNTALAWLAAALAASTAHFLYKYLQHRARARQRGLWQSWPIRTASLDQLDPVFCTNEFGPTTEALVTFLGRGNTHVPGGTSDTETWVLSALAKKSANIFEFGTCTGKTALHLAMNSGSAARITTLTLAPGQTGDYQRIPGDDEKLSRIAIRESSFTSFIYTPTAVAGKITQLFADSKDFDETPYVGAMDLIFVDGSHAYSYVVSDSAKALRMVAPGGLILWHDYRGPYETKDVYRALNELSGSRQLVHVQGTSLVAFRAEGKRTL